MILASILDPGTKTTPSSLRSLPFGLSISLEEVIKDELSRFYQFCSTEYDAVSLELKKLLLSSGGTDAWSTKTKEYEAAIQAFYDKNYPSSADRPHPIALIRMQRDVLQDKIVASRMDWELVGASVYPNLAKLAQRYLCLVVHSANAERANKVSSHAHHMLCGAPCVHVDAC